MARFISLRPDPVINKISGDKANTSQPFSYFPGLWNYTWTDKRNPRFYDNHVNNAYYKKTKYVNSIDYMGHFTHLPEDYIPVVAFFLKGSVNKARICTYGPEIGTDYKWDNDTPILSFNHAVHKDDYLDVQIRTALNPEYNANSATLTYYDYVPDAFFTYLKENNLPVYMGLTGYRYTLMLELYNLPQNVLHSFDLHKVPGIYKNLPYRYYNVKELNIIPEFKHLYVRKEELNLTFFKRHDCLNYETKIIELGDTGYYFINGTNIRMTEEITEDKFKLEDIGFIRLTSGSLTIDPKGYCKCNYGTKLEHRNTFIHDDCLYIGCEDDNIYREITKKDFAKYDIPRDACVRAKDKFVLRPGVEFDFPKKERKSAKTLTINLTHTPPQPHRYNREELEAYNLMMAEVIEGKLAYLDNKDSQGLLSDFSKLGWMKILVSATNTDTSTPLNPSNMQTIKKYLCAFLRNIYPNALCCGTVFIPIKCASLSTVVEYLHEIPKEIQYSSYRKPSTFHMDILRGFATAVQQVNLDKVRRSLLLSSL